MTAVSEADFQRELLELAGIYHWRVMHVRRSIGRRGGSAAWQTTTSVRGWPDLFAWHPTRGTVFAAEIKSAVGKVTAEQAEVLEELAACGIPTFVWRPDDLDEAVAVFAGSDAGFRTGVRVVSRESAQEARRATREPGGLSGSVLTGRVAVSGSDRPRSGGT